jgi:hypothetical protein
VFDKLGLVSVTGVQARMIRKRNQLATAQTCGERLSRLYRHEDDAVRFLLTIDAQLLSRAERQAKSSLLPATWLSAAARGWSTVRTTTP